MILGLMMHNTKSLEKAKPLGKYPYVKRAGDYLFVSGMSARLADGSVAGAVADPMGGATCDVCIQTRVVIEKIRNALREVGADLGDCVAVTSYLVDMKDFADYNAVYGDYFDCQGPARTTIAVHQLPHPHIVVELTATAYKPLGAA
jgi:2-aminomuconate deaminase